MRSNYFLSLVAVFSLLFIVACGGDAPKSDTSEKSDATEKDAGNAAAVSMSPFSSSPDFPGAKLELKGYDKGTFNFAVSNYELKSQTSDAPQKMCANSKDGQHIHLIIDNEPYAAKYDPSFAYEVADGQHFLLAFLSRSYHESIKTKDAHVAIKGQFAGGKMTESAPVTEPMLFYSRPKGTYVGKAETDKVMLDFYLANTTLAPDGNKVKVAVNGADAFVLDEWKPVFIEGLPMGDNKIKLTLIDKDGKTVAAPLNPVERVFTLKADPVE